MPHKRKNSPYWWASFTDASGNRVRCSTGTTNRKEAAALEAKWKAEIFQNAAWNIEPDRSFEELMLLYLKASAPEKRSEKSDRQRVKQLRKFFMGRVMNELNPSDIRGYIAMRREAGRKNSTINRELSLLSIAIRYGQKELEWDIPNPVSGRKLPEPEGRDRWITREEAANLIRAAGESTKAPHLSDFIVLGLHTGCRKQELLGLEWDRVDFRRNVITLDACHTKTKKRRTVPINDDARAALIKRARFRAEHCPDSRWVFCNKEGNRIGDVKTAFNRSCSIAGITDFTMHDLRHTCASWLVMAGRPILEVREMLGHASVTMTERYAHLAPDKLKDAARALESKSHSGHTDFFVTKKSSGRCS